MLLIWWCRRENCGQFERAMLVDSEFAKISLTSLLHAESKDMYAGMARSDVHLRPSLTCFTGRFPFDHQMS